MPALLSIDDLAVGYGELSVASGLKFTVEPGEFVCVVGPNGAGKSTLIKTIAGLIRPRQGSVTIDGRAVERWDRRRLARRLAVVLQLRATPPLFRVREMVALGRYPWVSVRGTARKATRLAGERAIQTALTLFDLSGFADRPLSTLSGGELQRVILARAVAQEPQLLLADEPTAFLDLHHQSSVLEMLHTRCRTQACGMLVVLHDLNLASLYADRIVLLGAAAGAAVGTPESILRPDLLLRAYGPGFRVIPSRTSGGRPVILPERPHRT